MSEEPTQIGVITKGALIEGLEMKLDVSQDIEDIKAGKFVVIRGKKNEFFSMITDMRLDATNPEILINPPAEEDHLVREVLSGHSTFATVSLRPMLMLGLEERLTGDEGAKPVKAIPAHFSTVYDAAEMMSVASSVPKEKTVGFSTWDRRWIWKRLSVSTWTGWWNEVTPYSARPVPVRRF